MTKNHTAFLKQIAAAFPLYHEGESSLYWKYTLEHVLPQNRVTVIPERGPWQTTGKVHADRVLKTNFSVCDGASAGIDAALAFEWIVNARAQTARYVPIETGLRSLSTRYSPAFFIPAILRKSVTGAISDDIRVNICRIDVANLGFSTEEQEQMVKVATTKLAAIVGLSAAEIITPRKNKP